MHNVCDGYAYNFMKDNLYIINSNRNTFNITANFNKTHKFFIEHTEYSVKEMQINTN